MAAETIRIDFSDQPPAQQPDAGNGSGSPASPPEHTSFTQPVPIKPATVRGSPAKPPEIRRPGAMWKPSAPKPAPLARPAGKSTPHKLKRRERPMGRRSASRRTQDETSFRIIPKSNDSWKVYVGVGVVFLLILLFCFAIGGPDKPAKAGPRRAPQSSSSWTPPVQRPQEPVRYAELGGMTMAEWETKNGNSTELREVRQRARRQYMAEAMAEERRGVGSR